VVKILEGEWLFGEFRILKFQAVVIIAAALLMAALYSFIQRTRIGKAIRSVSEDKETSSLMGINIDRMIVTTFVIGGMAAGAAGVLYAVMFKQVHFYMGFIPGIKAFTAAVLAASATFRERCWRNLSWPCRIGGTHPVPGRPGNCRALPTQGRHCFYPARSRADLSTDRHFGRAVGYQESLNKFGVLSSPAAVQVLWQAGSSENFTLVTFKFRSLESLQYATGN